MVAPPVMPVPVHWMVPKHPAAVRLAGEPAHTVAEDAVTDAGTVQEAGALNVRLAVPQADADESTVAVCTPKPLVSPVNVNGSDVVAAETLSTVDAVPTLTVTLPAVVLVKLTVPLRVYWLVTELQAPGVTVSDR